VTQRMRVLFLTTLVLATCYACQREVPAEKIGSESPQPAGTIDQAVEQNLEGIKRPMDKAREVEEILGKASERTVEQVQGATP